MRKTRTDYATLARQIADGVKWVVEYSKRFDGKYNIWRPVIEVHPSKCCDIYWEIVGVVDDERDAKLMVRTIKND